MGFREKVIVYGGLVVGGVVVVLLAKKGLEDLSEKIRGLFKLAITLPKFAKIKEDLGNLGEKLGDVVENMGKTVSDAVEDMNEQGKMWSRKLKAKKLSVEIVKIAKAEDYVVGTRPKIQEVLEKSGDIMDKVAEDLKQAIHIGKIWDVYEAKRMRI